MGRISEMPRHSEYLQASIDFVQDCATRPIDAEEVLDMTEVVLGEARSFEVWCNSESEGNQDLTKAERWVSAAEKIAYYAFIDDILSDTDEATALANLLGVREVPDLKYLMN